MSPTAAPAAFTVALLLAALGLKATDFAKYIVVGFFNRQGEDNKGKRREAQNGLLTVTTSCILGFLVVQFLVKPSAWGDEVTIGKERLSELGLGSTIVFGIVFTALAGTLYDFKKAVDNSDTAKKPKMLSDEARR